MRYLGRINLSNGRDDCRINQRSKNMNFVENIGHLSWASLIDHDFLIK